MNLIVTRPLEDAHPLKSKLENLGHCVILAPLLHIEPRQNVSLPDLPWQAIAATSANGIRMFRAPENLKSIRMLTVGPQSLEAAKKVGFRNANAHGGDLKGLAKHIAENLHPADGPILYLSGSETAGDLEGSLKALGFDCRRAIIYDAVPASNLGAAASALESRSVDGVMLFSPRSARLWCDIVGKADLLVEAASPHYFCLSGNVAAVLPKNWTKSVAKTPDESAMLALLVNHLKTR